MKYGKASVTVNGKCFSVDVQFDPAMLAGMDAEDSITRERARRRAWRTIAEEALHTSEDAMAEDTIIIVLR